MMRAWDRFWFGPVSARPLGAFRVLFGLACLQNLMLLAGSHETWLSDAGYLQGPEAAELAGPLRPSPLIWFQSPAAARTVLAVTAIVTVLFTIGWRTRWVGMALFACNLSIHNRNLLTCSGADVLLMALTFYLMLSPCGAAYSLDALRAARRGGGRSEPLIVPWAQRLIQAQISVLYFITALHKAGGATWREGTALYYVLGDPEFRRFTLGLTEYPLLVHGLSFGALVLEFGLAFLLWFRPTRLAVICAGVALHAGVLLTVNIPVFSELMMASYITFLSSSEWAGLRRALGRREASAAERPPTALAPGPHFALAKRRAARGG